MKTSEQPEASALSDSTGYGPFERAPEICRLPNYMEHSYEASYDPLTLKAQIEWMCENYDDVRISICSSYDAEHFTIDGNVRENSSNNQ